MALNLQTNDLPTQLHHALFEGSQGYVLKPLGMRTTRPYILIVLPLNPNPDPLTPARPRPQPSNLATEPTPNLSAIAKQACAPPSLTGLLPPSR